MKVKRRRLDAEDVGYYSHKRTRITADAPFQEFSAPVGQSMQTYEQARTPMQFKPGAFHQGNQDLDSDDYDSDLTDDRDFCKCMALIFILVWVLMVFGTLIASMCVRNEELGGPQNACGSTMILS